MPKGSGGGEGGEGGATLPRLRKAQLEQPVPIAHMDNIVGFPTTASKLDELVVNYNSIARSHDALVAWNLELRAKVVQLEARIKSQQPDAANLQAAPRSSSARSKPTAKNQPKSEIAKNSRRYWLYLQAVKRKAKKNKEENGQVFTKRLELMIEKMAERKWQGLTEEEKNTLSVK